MADSQDTTILPENRTDLEALIEAAIARLDAMDPDADLEDGFDDEPSLGALECPADFGRGTIWLNTAGCDTDLEDDSCEDEPSLGAPECMAYAPHLCGAMNQSYWARGSCDDREVACEDEGSADLSHQGSLGHLDCGPIRLGVRS